MNTNTMLKSKWYLVEMFTAKKTFRITVRKPLETKVEALTFENSRVKAHNYKSLLKLINEGWTDLNLVNDTVVETGKEIITEPIIEVVNADIETQIEAYTQAKIERDIKAYEEKKRKQDAVKNFLSTPPTQPIYKPFDYSKSWNRYETKGKPRAEKALNKQLAEYREV